MLYIYIDIYIYKTCIMPTHATRLVLIDSRVNDRDTVVRSLLADTKYVVVEFETDTLETIRAKIDLLGSFSFASVAIFQENYEMATYQFVQSFGQAVLENVAEVDGQLASWAPFAGLLSYFKNSLNIVNVDLLGCNIYSNQNWRFVIDTLNAGLGISIQSSNDETGNEYLGGNWIIESNNSNLIGSYFSEEIKTYKFVLGSSANHSGVILSSGEVLMCGVNSSGQLGDGSITGKSTPVYMQKPETDGAGNLVDAVALSCGGNHTVVLLNTGKVLACGSNASGQLGDGTTTSTGQTTSMVPVYMKDASGNTLSGAIAVSCGSNHTVVLLNDNTVLACGSNTNGQLGDGTITSTSSTTSKVPVYMKNSSGSGAIAVSCGINHTVVLLNDNTVLACGSNASGQFGDGTITSTGTTASKLPVYMKNSSGSTLTGAIAVSCGSAHTVVLLNDNTVLACGSNASGQFGDGTITSTSSTTSKVPVYMKDASGNTLSGAIAVSCGGSHTVVLLNDNTVLACGGNSSGQLGDGTITSTSSTTSKVPVYMKDASGNTLSGAKAVSCGSNHTLVLLNDNTVLACGSNASGQLGNGISNTNVLLNYMKNSSGSSLTGAVAVNCGNTHTAVLLNDNTVLACGSNASGQLGNGNTNTNVLLNYMKDASGNTLSGAKAVSCGSNHTMVLLNDNKVLACGNNSDGRLGDGTTTSTSSTTSKVPVYMKDASGNTLSGAKAVSCGNINTVVLLNTGNVLACGSNVFGQLGNGTITSTSSTTSKVPVYMKDASGNTLSGAKAVSCGGSHTLVLLNDNKVLACGFNGSGQLGDGTTTSTGSTTSKVPVYMKNSSGIILNIAKAVSCGSNHTVVLLNDNTVLACGSNSSGQLGDGTTTNTSSTTSKVPVYMKNSSGSILTGAKAVSCGSSYTVVLLNDNTVLACGSNTSGQLGDGTTTSTGTTASKLPVYMKNSSGSILTGVIAVSCGSEHTVVLLNDNTILACGYNNSGQLGNGNSEINTSFVYMINISLFQIYSINEWNDTVPTAPTDLNPIPGNMQLSIEFTEPYKGGSAITNYAYSTNGTTFTPFSPADITPPVTITGLNNGQSYTFYLRAVNAAGQGLSSTSVTSTTISHLAPSATGSATLAAILEDTTNPSGSPISTLFSSNFSSSTSNTLAGIAITSYTSNSSNGNWRYSSNSGSTWTDLSNVTSDTSAFCLLNTDYLSFLPALNWNGNAPTLTVVLIDNLVTVTRAAIVDASTSNRGGSSAFSLGTVVLSHVVTDVNDVPSAPSIVRTSTISGQISIEFTGPTNYGGSEVLRYEYSTSSEFSPFTTYNSTSSPLDISGLTNGQTYTYYLRAVNLAGKGVSSGPIAVNLPSASDLKTSGSTAEELKTQNFSCADLADASYSAYDIESAGYTFSDLIAAGFTSIEPTNSTQMTFALTESQFTNVEVNTDIKITSGLLVSSGLKQLSTTSADGIVITKN
jgi:alpha-tubulin suppressor-like RCC1 family protein